MKTWNRDSAFSDSYFLYLIVKTFLVMCQEILYNFLESQNFLHQKEILYRNSQMGMLIL